MVPFDGATFGAIADPKGFYRCGRAFYRYGEFLHCASMTFGLSSLRIYGHLHTCFQFFPHTSSSRDPDYAFILQFLVHYSTKCKYKINN